MITESLKNLNQKFLSTIHKINNSNRNQRTIRQILIIPIELGI